MIVLMMIVAQYLGLVMDMLIVKNLIILDVIYHVIIMMVEIVEKQPLVILMEIKF